MTVEETKAKVSFLNLFYIFQDFGKPENQSFLFRFFRQNMHKGNLKMRKNMQVA